MTINVANLLQEIIADAWAPDPIITVSEWADQHRRLSAKASSEHGPWKTSRTPYLRQPMDAFSVTHPAQEIVLVFASQTGKSEACNNCIGYAVDIAPGPILMVQPTDGMAKRYSKMRLAPMVESTPRLAMKVKPSRSRDSGNTLQLKEFTNDAMLVIGGANSASSLASMPIRYTVEDEVDRFPLDVDDEGSPSDLVTARTRTYGNRKKQIKTSTPTLAGVSRIWWEWERSSQNRYHVPCPHCGEHQVLSWDMMRYDPQDPLLKHERLSTPPVMICQACGTGIEERSKAWWYGEDLGKWIPENPGSPVEGYHLPGFYSPLGWLSWTEIVIGYEKAKDDPFKLKAWTNTVLAECWAEAGESPEWELLYRRREEYQRGVVPAGAAVLTLGVDCQRDRLECEVVAWGPNLESWSVDYLVIPGDTGTIQEDDSKPCPWRELAAVVNRTYPHVNGHELPFSMVAVDSGDQTQTVYGWVRSQHNPRVVAIKGRGAGMSSAVGVPTKQEVTIRGKRAKSGIKLWPVGVNIIKTELYGWLRQQPPLNDGDLLPKGYCHFPQYDEAYFLGLTAEELQSRTLKGFTIYEWVKVRPRNEQLDCRVYNRAASILLGLDRWPDSEWAQRLRALATPPDPVAPAEPQAPQPAAPQPVAPTRKRRASRRTAGMRR